MRTVVVFVDLSVCFVVKYGCEYFLFMQCFLQLKVGGFVKDADCYVNLVF